MVIKEKQIRFIRQSQEFEIIDHFHNVAQYGAGVTAPPMVTAASPFNWVVTTSGTNSGITPGTGATVGNPAVNTPLSTVLNPGIVCLQSGTVTGASASRSSLTTPAVINLGSAIIELEFAVRMTPGVSGQDHEEFLGFGDSTTDKSTTTAAYIYYDWSSSLGAQWQYITITNGTLNAVSSGVAPANQTFQRVNIRFSKSPVRATFSINGGNIITPSYVYPDGSATGLQFLFRKYEGSTLQFLDLDYVRFSYNAS